MKNLNSLSIMISILAIIFVSIIYNKKEIKKEEKLISKEIIHVEKYENDYDSIYQTTIFDCDTVSGGSLSVNLCSGERLEFAENLLKKCYEKHVKELENEIPSWKLQPDQELIHKNMLIELKKSQISWENYRNDVVSYTRYGCEGGTGCIAIFNSKNIELIFQRIEELED
jgi:uncharacterized protein YecT (DUF1311 family)